MGNTTIIEINHDRWGEIQDDKVAFADAVIAQCSSMEHSRKVEKTGKIWDGSIPGGQVIAGFHRSKGRVYDAWEAFKTKLIGIYQDQLSQRI